MVIGVIAVSAYRSSESYIQKNAANGILSIGTPAVPEGVKIGIDNCTYICTGMEVPIEPDESSIEYVEIPVDGDSTISAFARIHEDSEDYLVCLIGDEWFKFITE